MHISETLTSNKVKFYFLSSVCTFLYQSIKTIVVT